MYSLLKFASDIFFPGVIGIYQARAVFNSEPQAVKLAGSSPDPSCREAIHFTTWHGIT